MKFITWQDVDVSHVEEAAEPEQSIEDAEDEDEEDYHALPITKNQLFNS